MNSPRFFGVGPKFPWVGTSPAVDLRTTIGRNLDYPVNDGSYATADIHFVEDSTFSLLVFENETDHASKGDLTTKTFGAGTEIVGVVAYTLATGSIIAAHSK